MDAYFGIQSSFTAYLVVFSASLAARCPEDLKSWCANLNCMHPTSVHRYPHIHLLRQVGLLSLIHAICCKAATHALIADT